MPTLQTFFDDHRIVEPFSEFAYERHLISEKYYSYMGRGLVVPKNEAEDGNVGLSKFLRAGFALKPSALFL